jgi:transposase InsO family protein
VLTDNAKTYGSNLFAELCAEARVHHSWTRPYRPCTNGKAERFIQTMLREWAYKRAYTSSRRRTAALPRWLDRYNFRRPHGSLGRQAPITRVVTQQ